MSNACATAESGKRRALHWFLVLLLLQVAGNVCVAHAQAQQDQSSEASSSRTKRATTVGLFVAGAAIGLGAHEGGHLLFDFLFDADPGVRGVNFHGIPFFAITHREDLSPVKEFTISSAGFWVQSIGTEWILTRRPRLRDERAPIAKGLLAFNMAASTAYAGAAFLRTGPPERDTRGMATSAGVNERWIGAVILAPAAFDAWRYFNPESEAAVWLSRLAKVGGALLIVRAATR
jgi:hypothetical protein